MPTATPHDWNERYLKGETPWDSGVPSKELIRVLDEERIEPCRAVELGCGTGTNAIYLATRRFEVTGLDLSAIALDRARSNAAAAGARVEFMEADVCRFESRLEPFDFMFDRGCYHAVRRVDLAGFLETLRHLSMPGTRFLVLAGNAHQEGEGPPRVHEHEIRAEFKNLFEIDFIREFYFDGLVLPSPILGWSCLMTRRVS